jgi:hypothetical protein
MGHPVAREFNANPPPFAKRASSGLRTAFIPPAVGDRRVFWVEEGSPESGQWVQKQATLRATGQYGNIWVMDENYSSTPVSGSRITSAQAQALAEKFDLIYPAETNILGYEYGGGPGGDGGVDADPKIQMLVYDIGGGTIGYFWAKDFYDQSQMDSYGYKTNLAEIFYLDASYANSNPDLIYSTLIHEFQHMINFNVKSVKQGKSSDTWYNEMLSLMAQDVISDHVGITPENPDHEIRHRLPLFLRYYADYGITEWNSPYSYSTAFAFGAYLLRNYGGAELLKRILANNTTDIASITAALNDVSPGMTFAKALARYGEALVFSGPSMPPDVLTFDKTVTNTINGFTYTVHGFDIWNMNRTGGGFGPYVFGLTPASMRPRSISLHSINGWKNRSGNFSVTLNRPANQDVTLFLMVK